MSVGSIFSTILVQLERNASVLWGEVAKTALMGEPRPCCRAGEAGSQQVVLGYIAEPAQQPISSAALPPDVRRVSDFPHGAPALAGLRPGQIEAQPQNIDRKRKGSAFPHIERQSH